MLQNKMEFMEQQIQHDLSVYLWMHTGRRKNEALDTHDKNAYYLWGVKRILQGSFTIFPYTLVHF
jgi:hypothetical protein